jgi:hypothetical protein
MGLLERASNGEVWLYDLPVSGWLTERERRFCPPELLGRRIGSLRLDDLIVIRDAVAAAERALAREMN